MRVCLVTGSFPAMDCGVGDYTWQLACHLASAIDVTVVTSDRPPIRQFLARASRQPAVGRKDTASRLPTAYCRLPTGKEALDVRPVIRDWGVRSLPALCRERPTAS